MGKSDLHIELAHRSLVWLDVKATQRGIRGCEEVILDDGYVVDAAAIGALQEKWERLLVGKEVKIYTDPEHVDDYSFVFESKVSRSDFMNTFKRGNHTGDRLKAIANFHFIVTPKGLVTHSEVPEFWGLLEKSGHGLRLMKHPKYMKDTVLSLPEMAYKILRSSHVSKFTLWTDYAKAFKDDQQLEIELLNP